MPGRHPQRRYPIRSWSLLALFALCLSFALVARLENRYGDLAPAAPLRLLTYADGADWVGDDPRIRRSLHHDVDSYSASYGFVSFRDDPVEVKAAVPAAAYRDYRRRFGYRQQELDDLFTRQKQQLDQALEWARANRVSQQQLDEVAAEIRANYQSSVRNLITSRGFRYLDNSLLAADIPQLVRQNVPLFRPVAESLQETVTQFGYSPDDIIGTALPLVQTAIRYEALPPEQDGRVTAGFSPPLEVFMEGRGDCDAKSALLASILLNWDKVKLIGVGVPGHYLLGILQHPARGDAFVEYEGLTYVLMEPSGPAWVPPGVVSDYTLKWLDAQESTILEPISLN